MFRYKLSVLLLFILTLSITPVIGQKNGIKLPKHLKEISGLIFLNDSVLVAHNDGGDEPILYFLDLKGEEIHRVKIQGATNVDWEDIAFDGKKYIYIGDIGNNNNARKDICIYKINATGILNKDSVKSEKINISYTEQIEFPAIPLNKHFDAEGLSILNDTLYIFTKCRALPFDGKCYVYKVPTKAGSYKLSKNFELYIGKDGWWKDAVTAAEIRDDKCYLLTYNRLMIYEIINGKFKFLKHILLVPVSQKEAVAINSKGTIYLADEQQKLLGGGNLYKIKDKKTNQLKK